MLQQEPGNPIHKKSMDLNGVLKMGSKNQEIHCEAKTELRLKSAWQRRNLAFDQANLCSFEVLEMWVQQLFNRLMKDQPRGFAKVTLQQIIECDKQLFILAAHRTMGQLQSSSVADKPFNTVVKSLSESTEILQYLSPLPAVKTHEPPLRSDKPPKKVPKNNAKQTPGKESGPQPSKLQIPEGVTHMDGKPLCFKYQTGKCGYKGPNKRCAKGFHRCYKEGCGRERPYYLCTHTK